MHYSTLLLNRWTRSPRWLHDIREQQWHVQCGNVLFLYSVNREITNRTPKKRLCIVEQESKNTSTLWWHHTTVGRKCKNVIHTYPQTSQTVKIQISCPNWCVCQKWNWLNKQLSCVNCAFIMGVKFSSYNLCRRLNRLRLSYFCSFSGKSMRCICYIPWHLIYGRIRN